MQFGTGSFLSDFQSLADSIKADVEKQLNQSFKQFKVLEHKALEDPDNTSYFMKVLTDNNGHVKVKTTKHQAGGDWKTDIQEFDRGQALEDRSRNVPLENKEQQSKLGTTGTSNP